MWGARASGVKQAQINPSRPFPLNKWQTRTPLPENDDVVGRW